MRATLLDVGLVRLVFAAFTFILPPPLALVLLSVALFLIFIGAMHAAALALV
jgi:hypothetical protein